MTVAQVRLARNWGQTAILFKRRKNFLRERPQEVQDVEGRRVGDRVRHDRVPSLRSFDRFPRGGRLDYRRENNKVVK